MNRRHIPGNRIKIVNDTLYIDGNVRPFPKNVQFNYVFATSRPLTTDDARSLGIAEADLGTFEPMSASRINIQPFLSDAPADTYAYMAPLTSDIDYLDAIAGKAYGALYEILSAVDRAVYHIAERGLVNIQPFLSDAPADTYAYMAPLTSDMISRMKADGTMLAIAKFNDIAPYFSAEGANSYAFPFGEDADWTLANYGGPEGLLNDASTIMGVPTMWSSGTKPQKRESWELSRLSPIIK